MTNTRKWDGGGNCYYDIYTATWRVCHNNRDSIYLGDISGLPSDLAGATIVVQARSGQSWTTTVTAVLDRNSGQVIFTDSGRPSDTLISGSCRHEAVEGNRAHALSGRPVGLLLSR